jgi:hypothetical protein
MPATLDKVGLTVWAYNKQGKYVGRVEINHATLAAFTGIGKNPWHLLGERLFDQLTEEGLGAIEIMHSIEIGKEKTR